MALVCLFGSSVRKLCVGSVSEMRQTVIKKFPHLATQKFKLRYKDNELGRFVDVEEDGDELPPAGSEIRVEILEKVLVPETEVDLSQTQFDGIIDETQIIFNGNITKSRLRREHK